MARTPRLRNAHRVAVAIAALAIVAGQAACLAVPPPPLPDQGQPIRPTIIYGGVSPQPGVPLQEWPDGGSFVVQVASQGQSFYYDAFLDFDPTVNPLPVDLPTPIIPTGPDPVMVPIRPIAQPDPRFCHTVAVLVAHQFNQNSAHTPDSVGGDIVTWFYDPGGGDCPVIDAGAFENGAFFDASSP
ncbi:MAG TPA: hypothetical protein VK841_02445 [Polyangiaceae bacterium]|jgi:hypothetical protein|nr:hypothetical protein [Polyangiaceae bacterium]